MTVCPCRPSAQVEAPFYEEWWFLLVMALSSLIVVLLVVFALVLHGQNRKYKNCSTGGLSPTRRRLLPKGGAPLSLPHLCRPRHVPSHSVEWLQPTSFRRQQVQGSGPFEPFGFRTCFLICTVAQMH